MRTLRLLLFNLRKLSAFVLQGSAAQKLLAQSQKVKYNKVKR